MKLFLCLDAEKRLAAVAIQMDFRSNISKPGSTYPPLPRVQLRSTAGALLPVARVLSESPFYDWNRGLRLYIIN